jgi:uncharacterized lipoprotein YddW (UPF0748 family)
MISAVVRSATVSLAALLVVAPIALPSQTEVRALWVVRTSLTSPSMVAAMVDAAKAGGFNTLLVQVRGRGDAYYQHGIEPRPLALAALPSFDPLAATIVRAHAAGLRIHAWININLVAGMNPPISREHVIYRHPEWLMVPEALAQDLLHADPRDPQYTVRLQQYIHTRPRDVEGLYVSLVSDAARRYTVGVIRNIVERYDVDGVHLDYIRYPEEDFDYGRDTLAAFRSAVTADLTPDDRRRYDARSSVDPLTYPKAFPARWRAFRSDSLTAVVSQVRQVVRSVRPRAVLSAAVAPDLRVASVHRLQDWGTWLERGLIDVVCPMAYTPDGGVFATQIAAARQVAGDRRLWAGIGAYRLSEDQIVGNVQAARRLGAAGVILYSYDSLTEPPRGREYLAQVARAAFSTR